MAVLTVADAYLRLRVDGARLRKDVAANVEEGGATAGAAWGKLFKSGVIVATAGIGAAIGIGAVAADQASKFQQAMTQIRTQAGGTAKDVAVLSAQVLKLGTYTEQGPQQLAAALYHLKSVGLDNVQAMKALRTVSDLAAVGQSDLESTANALAGAWRTGIRGATNFGQAAATVNAIIGAGNMRMQDFVAAIGTGILPAAKTWGLSLGQVGGALALLTDEGQNAAEAATRLRMTFALLGAPSATAAKQLAAIGITGTQLGDAMRSPGGLVAAVGLLKSHLDASGLSATQAAALLARAFGGGRSSATILSLINNLETLRKKQAQINATTGRYGSAVAAQRKTAGAEFDRLGAIIQVFGIRLGLALLPPITAFVGYIVNHVVPAVSAVGALVSRTFEHIIPVGAIRHDWQAVLSFLGLSRPKPVTLSTSDLLHMPRPARLSTSDLLHPIAPATLPMNVDLLHKLPGGGKTDGGMTDSLTAMLSHINWSKIVGLLGAPLGEAIGKAVGSLGQHATVLVSDLVNALGGLDWVNIGKMVGGHTVGFAIGLVSSFASDLFSPSFWMHHWWDVIVAALALVGVSEIAGPIIKVLEHIPFLKMFAPLLRGVEKIGKPIGDAMLKALRFLWDGFTRGFQRGFPAAEGLLKRAWLDISTRIGSAAIDVGRKALSLAKGIGAGIVRGAENLGEVIGRVVNRIVSPFAGAGSWLVKAGGDVVGGLLRGIARFAAGIGSWINAHLVQPIINAVKSFFGIASPATAMIPLGGHIVGGLFKGIMNANPLAVVRKVFGSLPGALAHIVEKGLVSIADLPLKALVALENFGGSVLSKIAGFFGGGTNLAMDAVLSAALNIAGKPQSWLRGMEQVMALESGGNPNAVNPVSVDGQHATGLMQMLPSTFSAWALGGLGGILNPLANAVASARYIGAEYGSVYNIPNLFGGAYRGYKLGGLITEPIAGLGLRTGREYGFGESGIERVTPGAGLAPGADARLMERLLDKLDRLTDAVRKSAAQTGTATAQALDRGGRRAAYAGIYGG